MRRSLAASAKSALAKGAGWRRVVIEKPFGHDLASARQLSDEVHEVFRRTLGLSHRSLSGQRTVQNILAFRFGNGIFEPLWNRRYIDNVQITGAESIGVEGRGAYYQEAGALRDMIQNHLLQVMATVAMEPSSTFSPDTVRDERAKLLRSIRIMKPEEVERQRGRGTVWTGAHRRAGGAGIPPGEGRRSGVADRHVCRPPLSMSTTGDGPVFLFTSAAASTCRSGSAKSPFSSRTRRIICFEAWRRTAVITAPAAPNLLILRIQPEEGISLKFVSKRPGAGMTLRPVSMDFNYGSSFGERSPSAYETLLLDAIIGDPTLYTRQDMVEASWAVVEPIMRLVAGEARVPQLCGRHLGSRRHRTRCSLVMATSGGSREAVYGDHDQTRQDSEGAGESVDRDGCPFGDRQTGADVLRACAMTMIVIADETEDTQGIGETLAQLMKEHPSRAIVIRLRDCVEPCLESRVFAQCWKPFGSRQHICCEQIEITASHSSLPDVAAVVLPLVVADLPVILWCRSGRAPDLQGFRDLEVLAQKVIFDSASFPDHEKALAKLLTASLPGTRVADLAVGKADALAGIDCSGGE